MIFRIAPHNPIRFLPVGSVDPLPFDMESLPCFYGQKYLTSQETTIQILSDYPDFTCWVKDWDTNRNIVELFPAEVATSIIDQTYKCYEVAIPFSGLTGIVKIQIAYEDEFLQDIVYDSDPLQVATSFPDLLTFQYKNSENNYSVIFETGVEFLFNCEGKIREYDPLADDAIYNDQLRNATLLNSMPYDSWKLFIGNAIGVPEYIRKKVNLIFSCDQKRINGQYWERVEGSKWETQRVPENSFAGMQTEIMPVENYFYLRLKTGDQPPDGYIPVSKVFNKFNNGSDFAISTVFTKYSLLENIAVINRGLGFTLRIGLTPGGNEIGEFTLDAPTSPDTFLTDTLKVGYYFGAPSTVYLSGLAGTDADFSFDYLQFDEPSVPIGPPAAIDIPIGVICQYHNTGDISTDFNLVTGIGLGSYLGWVICDGRNGAPDLGGLLPVGYKAGDATFGTLNAGVGDSTYTLSEANIPEIVIQTNGVGGITSDPNGGGLGYNSTPKNKPVDTIGTATPTPIPLLPESIVLLFIKKVS